MQSEKIICEACKPNAQKVSEKTIERFLNQYSSWDLIIDQDVQKLSKIFTFKNFVEAQAFTNKVGEMAETEGHHPSITLEYGQVTVRWWSHKIMGLHEDDINLSIKTDILFEGLAQ